VKNKLKLCRCPKKWAADLDQALADPNNLIYFDHWGKRAEGIRKAVAAGKHIYCEKPIATDTSEAMELSLPV
jgi:predicted dehydrogenase